MCPLNLRKCYFSNQNLVITITKTFYSTIGHATHTIKIVLFLYLYELTHEYPLQTVT